MPVITRREAVGNLAMTAGIGAVFATAIGATSANAAPGPEARHEGARGSDLHVEWGMVHKPNEGAYEVKFHKAFSEPPTVLLTPCWHGQAAAVSYIETLDRVSHHEFKATSGNAAENYYVSWVAIGRRKD